MKAKIVRMEIISRVIISDTDTDETAVRKAWDKVAKDPRGYFDYDNIIEVEDDTECPYNPETDK